MKVLNLIHAYPPLHHAGAEWMLHEMNKFLVEQGHSVDVLLPITGIKEYEFEGVNVKGDFFPGNREFIKNADIIISHLDRAGKAFNLCELYKKPFVFVVHNTNPMNIIKFKPQVRRYIVYNTEYTKREMNYPCPGVVVHPPVDAKRYKVMGRRGSKLTLVNLFHRKGTATFQQIARLMPDRDFLGVEGGYGKQEKEAIKNVTYIENTPDMKKVYSQTRILLMPSLYESYGRTAVEALVSGIPVIAAPTPGLKESLGDAGIFCDPLKPEQWVEAVKSLDDPEAYKAQSKKCSDRFKAIEAEREKELKEFENFLFDIYERKI